MNIDENHGGNSNGHIKTSHQVIEKKYRWWEKPIKVIGLGVILYFVGTAFAEQLSHIKWHILNPDWSFFCFALLAAILMRLCVGGYYKVFLKLLGYPLFPYRTAMAVSWISFLGKYIPGKAAIVANVVYLLSRYKIRTSLSAMVPILNNGMTVLVALILSLPVLFLPWAREAIQFSWEWIVVLIIAAGITIWPRVFFCIADRLLRIFGRPPINITLNFRQMILPVILVMGQCIFSGIATWCILKMISPSLTLSSIPIVISITAMAGSLGIIALFVPAGFGVVEGVYLIALSPLIGSEMAALSAICLRLLHISTDVFMAIAGMLMLRGNVFDAKRV